MAESLPLHMLIGKRDGIYPVSKDVFNKKLSKARAYSMGDMGYDLYVAQCKLLEYDLAFQLAEFYINQLLVTKSDKRRSRSVKPNSKRKGTATRKSGQVAKGRRKAVSRSSRRP